jgi:hypothetical protein
MVRKYESGLAHALAQMRLRWATMCVWRLLQGQPQSQCKLNVISNLTQHMQANGWLILRVWLVNA